MKLDSRWEEIYGDTVNKYPLKVILYLLDKISSLLHECNNSVCSEKLSKLLEKVDPNELIALVEGSNNEELEEVLEEILNELFNLLHSCACTSS